MATITLKNIPESIYSQLKEQARSNHRSLNGEILFALQLYVSTKTARPSTEEMLRKAREFRERVKGSLSPAEIDRAIRGKRP